MDCWREARFDQKPTQGSSMAPHLPLEVITEILANLPVKSLLKFRLVCKTWCSLISSPQFVRKHLSSNTSAPKRIIELTPGQGLMFYSLHDSIVGYENSVILVRIENTNFHCIKNKELDSFCIMGSCDGLVCVKAYPKGKIFLWNPSTRDSKILPSISEVVDNCHYYSMGGFGYDYNSDDYKVLTLVPPEKSIENYKDFRGHKSMMYKLRTNSWRRIQDFPLDTSYKLVDESATFVSGALHWIASRGSRTTRVIISLDLASETYMEVPQPDYYIYGSRIGIGASSRGCLCLLVHNYAASQSYDIWVMKEYGLRESWTISIRIPQMVDGECVVGLRPVTWFSVNGEILLNINGKLATYNVHKNSVRYLFQTSYDYYSCPHGHVYVESLVSPNAYSNRGANEISRLNINVRSRTRVEESVGGDRWMNI